MSTLAKFPIEEAIKLIKAKQYEQVKEMLGATALLPVADQWTQASPFEQVILYKLLSAERAEVFFRRLRPEQQMFLLGTVEMGALGPVLEEMDAARAEKLFHRLSPEAIKRLQDDLLRGK